MKNKVTILTGLQWGDEGKGKLIDLLSPQFDIVVRYQGGANAGHTIICNNKKYILHLIPSGILTEGIICVIGNGTVIDINAMIEEIKFLNGEGIYTKGRIKLSSDAHIVMPYHKIIDSINEKSRNKIGTTQKGIGPAYFDKYARRGIKIGDLEYENSFRSKVKMNIEFLQETFPDSEELRNLNPEKISKQALTQYDSITEYIDDTRLFLNNSISKNKNILLEGAQGVLLDVDFGTYPYITSSSPTSGGACTGSGIPPNKITNVIGVFKAYTTRVGEGPFPTELNDETGNEIRQKGYEYGATTGRPRRCGWLDLVALKYACTINGVNELAITKSDVLTGFENVSTCTHYELDKKTIDYFLTNPETLKRITPAYKEFNGWKTDIRIATDFEKLPKEYKNYLHFIEEYTDKKIRYISTGPSREQIIIQS